MLLVWVTEASRSQVTFVIAAASGVPTKKLWPYETVDGADEIDGRAP